MSNTPNNGRKSSGGLNLNTDAIDRLVNADKKTYPKTNTDPGKEYKSKGFIDKIPSPIKALFIKFWFNGAVCFFIFWGLSLLVPSFLDMIFIIAVVLGMVNDLLVNNTFHFFEITPGSNNKWMMFPQRKFWTFFANMGYAVVITWIVAWIYTLITTALLATGLLSPESNEISFGVEPVSFGILYVAVDMAFIRERIAAGIPILVGWNDWGGHWQVIIGYDTMGTEYEGDDVIIVADPFDTTDHNQDGYGVYGAERFIYNFTFYDFFGDAPEHARDKCFVAVSPLQK